MLYKQIEVDVFLFLHFGLGYGCLATDGGRRLVDHCRGRGRYFHGRGLRRDSGEYLNKGFTSK